MKLQEYIDKDPDKVKKLANYLGCTPTYVYMVLAKKRRFSPEKALETSKFTGGECSVMELLFPDLGG